MFLHFLGFRGYKHHDFLLFFSIKMKWNTFRKIIFYTKTNRKLHFLRFSNTQNPKIMIFQWFFIKNESGHPQKSWFFHFSFIYKQKMKKSWFSRWLIFPTLSSPRPDFDQNFAISRPPAGKISHKSDIFISLSWTEVIIYICKKL